MVRPSILRFGILLLASYGLFYASYKFYIPFGQTDFTQYYQMYQRPLDYTAADAPFVYRQISAMVTHTIYAAGIYYPNEIAFADPRIDQRIFFAALLSNYFGLLLAATLAGQIVARKIRSFVFPLLAGLLCLLSFHSQSAVITGLTDGITWLFVAGLYLLYVQENRLAFGLLLLLSVFQRELLAVVFGLIATFSLLAGHGNRRHNLFVLAWSALCFITYLFVDAYVIRAWASYSHLSFGRLLENLASPQTESLRDLVFQGLLSQNVIFITVLISTLLWLRTRVFPRELLVLLLTFSAIVVIGLSGGIGNNVGRIGGLLSPLFAALAATGFYRYDKSLNAGSAVKPDHTETEC